MPVDCPSASEWDVYILDPSGADRERLTAHLEKCPYCQVAVAELKRVWLELTARAAASRGPGLVLLPFDESPDFDGLRSLAAKGVSDSGEPRSLTLATEDRTMWLKAVRDKESGELWLYLYSDDSPEVPKNAVVKPFGSDREYLTDAHGRINLGKVDWPKKEALRAEVRLPRATFRLAEVGDIERTAGDATLTSPEGDRLHVSWTGDERGRHITIEVQALSGLSSQSPLQIAVRARGVDQPVQVRSSLLDHPVTVDHSGSLDQIEIFVYQ